MFEQVTNAVVFSGEDSLAPPWIKYFMKPFFLNPNFVSAIPLKPMCVFIMSFTNLGGGGPLVAPEALSSRFT